MSLTAFVTAAPPGAPTQPKLDHVTALSIAIHWKDGHDHGEAITKYRVEFVRFPPEVAKSFDDPVHTDLEVYSFRQPEDKDASVGANDEDESKDAARVRVCVGCSCGPLR